MTAEHGEFADQSGPARATPRRPISRRALGVGAVWSVPVIMTAVAAPAAAASVTPKPIVGPTLTAEKVSSAKRLDFTLTLSNTGNAAATVDVLSVTSDAPAGTQTGLPTSVVIPVGGSGVVHFSWDYGNNNATADYTVTYRVSGVGTSTVHIIR